METLPSAAVNPGHSVYVAGAIRGVRTCAVTIQSIVRHVGQLGHRVLTEHLDSDDPPAAHAALLGIAPELLTPEVVDECDMGWLAQATHVIVEATGASTGTGREIEFARLKHLLGHPKAGILVLYRLDHESSVSMLVRGLTRECYRDAVQVTPYFSEQQLLRVVSFFLGGCRSV